MKITILHPAQTVGAKNKVLDHKPGDEIDTDDTQANRLIGAGYAKAKPGTTEASSSTASSEGGSGGMGTGGTGGTGTGTGGASPDGSGAGSTPAA